MLRTYSLLALCPVFSVTLDKTNCHTENEPVWWCKGTATCLRCQLEKWSHVFNKDFLACYCLDEWSSLRRDLYIATHNTLKKQTSMPPAVFKPAIPGSKRPQTHALRWVKTCNVTPYRNAVSWQRGRDSWPRNITGLFGVLSIFGRRIKGMIRLRNKQVWTCNVTRYHPRSFLFFCKA